MRALAKFFASQQFAIKYKDELEIECNWLMGFDIEKAIKIVEERMSDSDFSVEMLGAELGLSRSHLYKKLMCITGKGPAEFIRIIRLKRSKQLLKESQKQIAEIAYEVGFSSPKRFTVNFKNEFGISPSDYIRSLK